MREDRINKIQLKLNYFFQKIFGEKDLGNIGFNFDDKPNRQDIIQKIIDIKKFKTYLEIGCDNDELFNFIKCEKKIGVDPEKGGNIRSTSDNFFKKNNLFFDLIFIDGLHEFDQVCKDIENSLNFLSNNGVIILHDCLPNNVYQQIVPRCKRTWNGDVWKAIVKYRTDDNLDIYTCNADSGLGIIFKRKNKNKLEKKINNYKNLKFREFFYDHKKLMNLIEYNELFKLI
jgi:hypothetical protein